MPDKKTPKWCECGGRLRKGTRAREGKYDYFICIVCGVDFWFEVEEDGVDGGAGTGVEGRK